MDVLSIPGNSGRELGEFSRDGMPVHHMSAYSHTNATHSHLGAHSHLGNQPKCIFFGQLEVTGKLEGLHQTGSSGSNQEHWAVIKQTLYIP